MPGPNPTWPPVGRRSTSASAIIEDGPADDDDEELEDYDFEDEEQPVDGEEGFAPAAAAGTPSRQEASPFIQFLFNCWAELQRVESPTGSS